MSTWTALLDELTAIEKAKVMVQKHADQMVKQSERKVALVKEKLLETQLSHEKQMRSIQEQSEAQIAEHTAKASRDVAAAREALSSAEARKKAAEERTRLAEERARELETQVRNLHALLDNTDEMEAMKREACRSVTNQTVVQKLAATNQQIKEMSSYAAEVQNGTFRAMQEMHSDHKVELEATDEKAQSRSRFDQLCNLNGVPRENVQKDGTFTEAKEELLGSWHTDWADTADSSTPTNRRLIQIGALVARRNIGSPDSAAPAPREGWGEA